MGKGAREAALFALDAASRRGLPAGDTLRSALDRRTLSVADRALATQLVSGVLRQRLRLDMVIDQLARRGVRSLDQVTLNILRLGVYQIQYLDRIPPHAAVKETVDLARRRDMNKGRAGLVNAILRRLLRQDIEPILPDPSRDPSGHVSVLHSIPRWLADRWLNQLGYDDAVALGAASNRSPGISIRVNTLRVEPDDLALDLAGAGVETVPGRYLSEALHLLAPVKPDSLDAFCRGLFYVQDEGAMIVSTVVGPRPGERILDAAAAPGGKSTHLAEMMGDRGEVVALDISERRLGMVEQSARRLGLESIRTVMGDARNAGSVPGGEFDRVLVDAPCSGLGVIRRRPDIKWRKGPDDPARMASVQEEVLYGASRVVAPGGVLVYAVCSTEPEETLGVVKKFGDRADEFAADDLSLILPSSLSGEKGAGDGYVYLWPHRHLTDGFFVARWTRRNTGTGADNGRLQGKDL